MWHISSSKGVFFIKNASRNIRQVCYPAEQCAFWLWKLFVMLWKQALVKAELTTLLSKDKTGATGTDKKKKFAEFSTVVYHKTITLPFRKKNVQTKQPGLGLFVCLFLITPYLQSLWSDIPGFVAIRERKEYINCRQSQQETSSNGT